MCGALEDPASLAEQLKLSRAAGSLLAERVLGWALRRGCGASCLRSGRTCATLGQSGRRATCTSRVTPRRTEVAAGCRARGARPAHRGPACVCACARPLTKLCVPSGRVRSGPVGCDLASPTRAWPKRGALTSVVYLTILFVNVLNVRGRARPDQPGSALQPSCRNDFV